MARRIHSRLRIRGVLVTQTPLHVGGYDEDFETHMARARNGRGEFYVPGMSLAGSFRSWFHTAFGRASMEPLFGNEQAEFASFVFAEDAVLSDQVQPELRDGVGIDRIYGAAADKAKYDRAVLPKGTRLKLELTVDIAARKLKSTVKDKSEKYDETEIEFNSRVAKTKVMFLFFSTRCTTSRYGWAQQNSWARESRA